MDFFYSSLVTFNLVLPLLCMFYLFTQGGPSVSFLLHVERPLIAIDRQTSRQTDNYLNYEKNIIADGGGGR